MFIDPSMGGMVYNPFRSRAPILQRYGEMNPSQNFAHTPTVEGSNSTAYRFFGSQGMQQGQGMSQGGPLNSSYKVFRNFF